MTKQSIVREDVMKHNKKLKPGMQPVPVPAPFQPDLKEAKIQLENFEKEFLER